MRITTIKVNDKNKNRASIYFDGEFYCAIQLETVLKHRLKVGDDFNTDEFQKLILESENLMALSKATNLISRTYKTKFQMEEYLKRKGYDLITINHVLGKLSEYGYINDTKYAQIYANQKKNICGKIKIKNELIKKGINKNIIDKVLNDVHIDERTIQDIIKKFMRNKEYNIENKQKLYRHLLAKGFNYEEIKKFIDF